MLTPRFHTLYRRDIDRVMWKVICQRPSPARVKATRCRRQAGSLGVWCSPVLPTRSGAWNCSQRSACTCPTLSWKPVAGV